MKKLILLILLSITLAAEEELSLDPADIPLPSEPTPESSQPSLPDLQAPQGTESAPKESVNIEVPVNQIIPQEVKTIPQEPPKEVILRSDPVIPDNLKVNTAEVQGVEPNLRLEEKFNRIYEQYNKSETSVENWEKVVGSRKSETYVVQKGDTLWDISRTLFGDPFFWPKIWALNKEIIFNPHEIDPKMNIKFYPGSEMQVPSLAVVNKEDVNAAPPEEAIKESKKEAQTEGAEKADDGPRDRRIGDSTTPIPKSFPDYYVSSSKTEKSITLEERVIKVTEPSIPLEFVLKESEIESNGVISETEIGAKTAAPYQYVYVKLNDSGTKQFTVLKPAKMVKDALDKESTIYLYEVEGEVEVLNKVNSEENVFRAIVKKARNFVSSGSLLVPGNMRTIQPVDGMESQANQGQIIGNLNNNRLIAKNSFVILNQGAQSGYTQGKIVPIFMNNNNRSEKSIVVENQQKIGKIAIVDATERYSVGYVLRIYEQVYVMDFVGANTHGATDSAVNSISDEGELSPDSSSSDSSTSDSSENF